MTATSEGTVVKGGVKVRDAMTEQVFTITPGLTLREAAQFMVNHNIGAAVIMDPEEPGPGIVTERDIVRSLGSGEDKAAVFVAAMLAPRRGPRRRARGHHLDARHHPRLAADELTRRITRRYSTCGIPA